MRRWILACALCGCASVPTKPALIAQTCASVPGPSGRIQRAYIELASVKNGDLPRALAKLKLEPVAVQQVTGVLVEDQNPVPLTWDRCLDKKCELKLTRTLLVTGYLPSERTDPVRIEVMIREGVGEHATMNIERMETRDQQPVTFDEHGDRSRMVATPYLLTNEDDSKRLAACLGK